MKKISALLLMLAFFVCSAEAHQDRILHIAADGSIRDVPAEFGKVQLTVDGLGSVKPLVKLRIGAHETTLPACVARTIRAVKPAQIQAYASWYHDEKPSLPYYLNIRIFHPGYDPKRSYNSSHEFLFNLHNAKLIHAKEFEAELSGNGGRYRGLKLPVGCDLDINN
jgi:hypothetical protein